MPAVPLLALLLLAGPGGYETVPDVRYRTVGGVPAELRSLDLYVPAGPAPAGGRGCVVMVHGGGWRVGDKTGRHVTGAKVGHFTGRGMIFASVNYRLTRPGNAVRHPDHADDVACALAYLHDHLPEFGGNRDAIHLIGHSAGAHLAGLVATDARLLAAHGESPRILKSVTLLDTAAIDLPRVMKEGGGRVYTAAFGTDPAGWKDASPVTHINQDAGTPPTLIVWGGPRSGLWETAPGMAKTLRDAGTPAAAVRVRGLSHTQINAVVGREGDPLTALIDRLIAGEDPATFPAGVSYGG